MDALVGDIQQVSLQEDPKVTREFTKEEQQIAALARNPQWKVITDYIEERAAFYRDDLAGADLTGLDLARVGEKYIVCHAVAAELSSLLNRVNLITQEVERGRGV